MAEIGISRVKREITKGSKKSFTWDYFDQYGKQISDPRTIDRCDSLVNPANFGKEEYGKMIWRY